MISVTIQANSLDGRAVTGHPLDLFLGLGRDAGKGRADALQQPVVGQASVLHCKAEKLKGRTVRLQSRATLTAINQRTEFEHQRQVIRKLTVQNGQHAGVAVHLLETQKGLTATASITIGPVRQVQGMTT